MMKRSITGFALSALLLMGSARAPGAEVRDKAGLFSSEAVNKAQAELDRLEKEYKVPVTIETISSLDGEPIREVTTRHAEAVSAHGIYILIAKKEAKIFGEASRGFRSYFPRDRFTAIDNAFTDDFKAKNFDAGLDKGVAKISSVFDAARAEAGGSLKPSEPAPRRGVQPARAGRAGGIAGKPAWGGYSVFSIILGILALFLVIRVIGALFANRSGYSNANRMGGGPGYGPGGPGYGGGGGYGAPGGGGGFMNSMFGGIGGALAGNWLYDQFSGGRHNSGYADQAGYDPNAGVAPTEPAAPEWGEGGAGGDWGGGSADTGGGGDWGGGGADTGGDWGGGGGGDDGASW